MIKSLVAAVALTIGLRARAMVEIDVVLLDRL